jgi:hypothetical protein
VRASAGGGIVSAQGPAQGLRACGAHASGAAQRGGRAGSAQGSARQRAAELRAARAYEERCQRALAQAAKLGAHKTEAKNHPQRTTATRLSTTGPEARVMKLADGGFRPAYNLQFAIDTASRSIVGVGACNAGTDSQQLAPMLDQIERRTGGVPGQHLADGGYLNFTAVEQAAARGVEVLVPARANRTYHIDPLSPQPRRQCGDRRVSKTHGLAAGPAHLLTGAGRHRRNRQRRPQILARPRPLAGARHQQGADRRDLVGAGLQPDALDQNGLLVRLPLSAYLRRRACLKN